MRSRSPAGSWGQCLTLRRSREFAKLQSPRPIRPREKRPLLRAAWCIDLLFASGMIANGPVWDPACGLSMIVDAARRVGRIAIGTDLVSRGSPLQSARHDSRPLSQSLHSHFSMSDRQFWEPQSGTCFGKSMVARSARGRYRESFFLLRVPDLENWHGTLTGEGLSKPCSIAR